ncbi:MAG: heavy metal response regulator transcription factor [Phycisphaerales bacterium]|nr:heavy metal response regulator transcription factor [Phycisphaerales bacterium]
MRALVIEDEPAVAGFVGKGLREASFVVELADNGIDGCRLALTNDYDVVVLDLMLPGKDGFKVLHDLRRGEKQTPVICLTARDSVDDRVKGLDLGADDYLAKPFSFAELLARIRALLRRGRAMVGNPIVVSDLTIDILARDVRRGGTRIDLSANEYRLLEYLARNAGCVLSRTMILEHVWDMNQDPMTNVIDVHVNRLRKKIDARFDPPLIHTVRGVGYVLRSAES